MCSRLHYLYILNQNQLFLSGSLAWRVYLLFMGLWGYGVMGLWGYGVMGLWGYFTKTQYDKSV